MDHTGRSKRVAKRQKVSNQTKNILLFGNSRIGLCEKQAPSHRLGAVSLQHLDGVHHPQDFMFRSLSHEEEGQSIAGEVEEPLPLPGGTGLRVRGEGCCHEVRRED